MQIDYSLHTAIAIWSVALGCFLCVVNDFFRAFRLGKRQNPVLVFFSDLLFCLIAASSFAILFFNLSFGRMRAYAFVFGGLGFLIWRMTVSRLFMLMLKKLYSLASRILNSIINGIREFLKSLLLHINTRLYCQRICKKAQKGFGLYKKMRKENS